MPVARGLVSTWLLPLHRYYWPRRSARLASCVGVAILCCSADWVEPYTRAREVLTFCLAWLARLTMQHVRHTCDDVLQDLHAEFSLRLVLQSPEEMEILVLGPCILRPPVMCGTTMAVHPPPRELVVFGRTVSRRTRRPFALCPRWRVSPSL